MLVTVVASCATTGIANRHEAGFNSEDLNLYPSLSLQIRDHDCLSTAESYCDFSGGLKVREMILRPVQSTDQQDKSG